MKIPLLGNDDKPESCLFFLLKPEAAVNRMLWGEKCSAEGIAALVSPDGILCTAAHVLWQNGLGPGSEVCVFYATAPLRARARILERGWRGPDRSQVAHPLYAETYDERRANTKEDMALLELIEHSFDLDSDRGGDIPDFADMLDALRVMPFSAPGYPVNSRRTLEAWCTFNDLAAPSLIRRSGEFFAPAPSLYTAFQFTSERITHGFSGSPLWDERRRLCVGLVRAYLGEKEEQMLVATDARALQHCGGVPMAADTGLRLAMHTVRAAIDNVPAAFALNAPIGETFVMPWARPSIPRALLDAGDAQDERGPALDLLRNTLAEGLPVLLAGGAGTGKSTMLRMLALDLLERPQLGSDGRRVLPVLLTASELSGAELELTSVLRTVRERAPDANVEIPTLIAAVAENDIDLVLLIDGLDEIDQRFAARLISQCFGMSRAANPVVHVVIAMRPHHKLISSPSGHNRWNMRMIELLPFDQSQVEDFALRQFRNAHEQEAFLNALLGVDWKRDATPWQLEMAAAVHQQQGQLGKNEASLIFDFIAIRLGEVRNAPPDLPLMLGVLARAGLATDQQLLSDALPLVRAAFSEQHAQDIAHYLARPASTRLALVRVVNTAAGATLEWAHRSVMEGMAAQAIVRELGNQPAQLQAELVPNPRREHRFILTLLSAMEAARLHAAVAVRVERAMAAPSSDREESLLALRALAAGLQFAPALRYRLVALLIRVVLAPKIDTMRCAELFTPLSSLPSARSIIQRPELRNDVRRAIWERFRLRARGTGQPVRVSPNEGALLDLVEMWNEWIDEGLVLKPRAQGAALPLPKPAAARPAPRVAAGPTQLQVLDRGGFSVIDAEGMSRQYEMPAGAFLEGVAKFAQQLPRLPPAQIVQLYLRSIASRTRPLGHPVEDDDAMPV